MKKMLFILVLCTNLGYATPYSDIRLEILSQIKVLEEKLNKLKELKGNAKDKKLEEKIEKIQKKIKKLKEELRRYEKNTGTIVG